MLQQPGQWQVRSRVTERGSGQTGTSWRAAQRASAHFFKRMPACTFICVLTPSLYEFALLALAWGQLLFRYHYRPGAGNRAQL